MDEEQTNALIDIIGEDLIQKAFDIVGNEKVSFARLQQSIRQRQIGQALDEGHSFSRIAKNFGISRMTVYRIFNKECRCGKNSS